MITDLRAWPEFQEKIAIYKEKAMPVSTSTWSNGELSNYNLKIFLYFAHYITYLMFKRFAIRFYSIILGL